MHWGDLLPPAELTEFLRGIKLQHLDVKLADLGYDDVDDFKNFDAHSRGERVRGRSRVGRASGRQC